MGLAYDKDNNKYVYGSVYDGCLMSVEKSFDKQADFIEWLGSCSDYSLSGQDLDQFYRGNQRITRDRLEKEGSVYTDLGFQY